MTQQPDNQPPDQPPLSEQPLRPVKRTWVNPVFASAVSITALAAAAGTYYCTYVEVNLPPGLPPTTRMVITQPTAADDDAPTDPPGESE